SASAQVRQPSSTRFRRRWPSPLTRQPPEPGRLPWRATTGTSERTGFVVSSKRSLASGRGSAGRGAQGVILATEADRSMDASQLPGQRRASQTCSVADGTGRTGGPIRVLELRSVRGTGGGPEKTILLGAPQSDPSRFAVTVCYIRDTRDQVFSLDQRARQL